jgi:endonuclease/exonuclease/phosphatase family metal-dependent hydrolase/methionine-rich copper-binding protein CopC
MAPNCHRLIQGATGVAEELVMTITSTPTTSRRLSRRLSVVAAVAAGAVAVLAPTAASAHSSMPGTPTALRVVKATPSSFTVTANAAAQRYRLYAATTRHALGSVRINRAHRSDLGSRPTLTVKGLHYSTTQYFYRVEAINGTHHRFSAIEGTVGLQPTAPTNVVATATPLGLSLSWDSGPVTGYVVTQATDAAMTHDVKTYSVLHQDHQFTPYDLTPGTTYYFTVTAVNGATTSAPSAVASATCQNDEQPLRLMTYNILKATGDGRLEGGNHVAPWSQRRLAIRDFILQADPDVVNIEEGMSWVPGPNGNERAVDDLVSLLGGQYSLAETEAPPNQRGTQRLGVYVLYKTDEFTTLDNGGHWDVGDLHYAAYQALEDTTSGAKFLDVTPHLEVALKGADDEMRLNEDKTMVADATQYAHSLGDLPIVYAGDFNSDPSHAHEFNGPSDYNLSVGMDDAFDVAQTRTNAQYNSGNGYETTPPALGLRIDYIFTTPGVAVKTWSLLIDLVHGKWAGVIPSDHNPLVADLEIPFAAGS